MGSHKHTFSVELKSKEYLHQIAVSKESQGEVLFEGELGKIVEVELVEGKVLEITGENGVLRLDICESLLLEKLKVT
ncbi:MAG: hypothetical protein NWE89_15640 [Candidatus Bathyarchaeota archaeon]|nr:hypothetical protein [Candidatus Bathyarchaeota archaeon]